MIINAVRLQNFRSFDKREFGLARLTVVVGNNGTGKSNLLEAIYLLAIGKSFRAEREDEMIKYNETAARVSATIEGEEKMEVVLLDGINGGSRKRFFINGVAKRMIDFTGRVRAVLFGPADLDLVTGNPSGRRRYLDFVISQSDREYRRSLVSYEKGLRQRNKLLDAIREGTAGRHQLFFWDRLLIKNGQYITDQRQEYLTKLNQTGKKYSVEYDKSLISEVRLKQYEDEEVAAAATLVGPHRDDFVVNMEGHDVAKFGSRGEQRMGVLWLKMGELAHLVQGNDQPILLLDDVFSELDHKHRDEVVKVVEKQRERGGQVIMTTADEHLAPLGGDWKSVELG